MKSILSKLVLLISVCVLSATIFIGTLAIIRMRSSMTEASTQTLTLTCSENARSINIILERMEKSVEILADYSINNLEEDVIPATTFSLDSYVNSLEALAKSITNERDGAAGIFVRFAKEIAGDSSGFYLVKDNETKEFNRFPVTPIGDSANPAFEWYYGPKDNGAPLWIGPYSDVATGNLVISYVAPMFVEDGDGQQIFLGVTGIDVSFEYLSQIVDDIRLYESGFAFLTDKDLQVIHSKYEFDKNNEKATIDITDIEKNEMVLDYKHNDRMMKITFRSLDNGMCLAATVSHTEIHGDILMLMIEIVLTTICFIVIFLYIAFNVAKNIISPLRELTHVATKVADGDLDVEFEYEGNDEIAMLTASLKTTVKELKKRISFTDSLAYQDSLTGLNNATAYARDKEKFANSFADGTQSNAIFIIDINGLKTINDTFGHKVGNDLIITSGKAIGSVFGYENVYRIGGDEFLAIVHGASEEGCQALKESLESTLKNQSGRILPSLAVGYALSANRDADYEHIFELADEAMYTEKIKIKSNGITSRVLK